MRALLVHNPTAGTKGHDKDSIVDALHLADFKVHYVSTKEDHVKDALKDARDLVVAAGGDGTVAYVFTHLPDHSIPIGVLPLGSANNIARSLGIAGTPQELAELWRSGHTRPFNLMVVDGLKDEKLCTEAFGVGLIAALIERRAKGKKADGADDLRRGRLALSEIVAKAEPLDIEVKVDGQPWKSDLLGVEVLTIPFTGPALPLAHDADPSDRLLDAVGVEREGGEAFIEWIKAPQDCEPPVITCQGKKIEVRWRGVESRIDDELVKAKSDWQEVTLSCHAEPLRILVPAQHPAVRKSANGCLATSK
jgi:diacylglycerol kinase (ATP)